MKLVGSLFRKSYKPYYTYSIYSVTNSTNLTIHKHAWAFQICTLYLKTSAHLVHNMALKLLPRQ